MPRCEQTDDDEVEAGADDGSRRAGVGEVGLQVPRGEDGLPDEEGRDRGDDTGYRRDDAEHGGLDGEDEGSLPGGCEGGPDRAGLAFAGPQRGESVCSRPGFRSICCPARTSGTGRGPRPRVQLEPAIPAPVYPGMPRSGVWFIRTSTVRSRGGRKSRMNGLGPAVIALVGTLLGAGLTATVALYTSYATRRHEAEVERRSFERDELKRRRGRQEELYTRFIQAGHDVEVAITQFADANRTGPSAIQIADQIEDFRKLAREVRLFASTNVSGRIDDLVESWDQWV